MTNTFHPINNTLLSGIFLTNSVNISEDICLIKKFGRVELEEAVSPGAGRPTEQGPAGPRRGKFEPLLGFVGERGQNWQWQLQLPGN